MKQRIIALLMVLVLLASCFCACKKNEEHSHSFSGSYTSDETHHWYACSCGEKSEYAQHNWNDGVITIRPTTENEGEKVFTCTVCRAKKVEKLDKLTVDHIHSFTQKYHSDAENHWYECFCGEKSEVAEHSFNDGVVTVKPTMDKEGVKTYTCTVCKYEKTEAIEKIDPDHEHNYSASVSDEYSHWMECFCGSVDAKAEHSFGEGEITTPNSDIQAGIITYACADCGHKKTEIIKANTANGLSFLQSTHYRISDIFHATPLTLEAEIYVDPATTGRAGVVFGNYYGIRQDWLFEIYENGVPRFYYSDAAGNVKDYKFTQVDVRTGDFVHVALTFDFENRAMSLYLDGEVKQVIALEADLAQDITRYQFVVGGDNRSNNGMFFRGQIRSIAAYSDVRTAEEIASAVEKGTNLYADDLIVAYLLNKESGNNDIIDLSGNGYIIQKEWLDSHEPTLDYAYSFAVVGDTQWLSKYKPEKFEGIYEWLLENKDEKKIAHVFGLGDITEDWNTANKELEWVRAQEYIYKLNGIIPYSLVRGNHDESKYFNKYFATEEYMNQYGGVYMVDGDVRNSYKLFTVGSTDYLLLTLDFGASDEILEWANQVVLDHPDRRVIITTHAYHGFDGGHLNYDNVMSSGNITSASDVDTSVGDNGNRGYNNGQQIWEKFVSKHPNIFLVLSGHTPPEDVLVLKSEGNHGNIVNQMLIDPQWMDPQKDGVGMVCMLYFSEDGTQMEVEWVSTDTGKYYKEQNQFVMDLTDSLNASAHSFGASYDDNHHFQACACGYTHSEEPHEYDGGTLNVDGFMEYTCECGHKRITSATDDPVAIELQAILEKYSKGGVYFKELNSSAKNLTTFYKGDRFWTTDDTDYESTADHITLQDIVMGKYGDLRLDLGWNCYDGVYSSVNNNTIDGICMFALGVNDASAGGVTKVTVEENGYLVIIKTWSGDSVLAETTIGHYATTTLLNLNGETIDTIYTKSNANGFCEIVTPKLDGLVSEYDKIILNVEHDLLEKSCYYSTITTWDGISVSTSLSGSGTIDDPYLVQSGADLAYIADVVNKAGAQTPNFSGKYFKMTQSIDLDGHDLFIGSYPGWGDRRGFFGFFDGNHCTVRGLNSSSSLFGTIETGWLKDLSVYGKVNGNTTVGGIVGYVANGGKVENLTNYANVSGVNTIGGVVGNSENQASTVINCVNYGNVNGTSWIIGGVVGSAGHDVHNCVNYGTVTSTDDCVGGIAGSTKNTGSIANCINYGVINARGKAAGIAGSANKLVTGCINYGEVNGVWALGGIVGHMKPEDVATIVNCVNNGNINGTTTGNGGILGILEGSATASGFVTIKGCVNTGSVTATWGAGGIAGDCVGDISDCVNYGKVSGTGELGGIIGKCYGKVTGCTNYGEVNARQAIVGGIVGHLHVTTYLDVITSTNSNEGEVIGPGAQDIIGK